MKFPSTLGACIDLAYKAREARLAYQRKMEEELEKLKAAEKAIEDHIINGFKKEEVEGSKGKLATAGITKLTVAQVKDWDKFFTWVAQKKAFEMLRKQVNDKAYRERLDAKQKVPGVTPFVITKLSLTKR